MRVSVIIPTYNRSALVMEAISSVLNQTFLDIEVLVVDDGSTDETTRALATIHDPRLRIYRIEHNGLPAVARNYGIERAQGEFVAFLDSDDRWTPEKLEKQMAVAQANPSVGLFYGLARTFDSNGTGELTTASSMCHTGWIFDRLLFHNFIPTPTVLVRKAVFQSVGLFDTHPKFKAIEDYDLWLRISQRYPVQFIPEILALYRIHGDNLSGTPEAIFQRQELLLEKTLTP